MITTVTIIHLLLAILVIVITFFQDSKSESLGGPWGGSSSQSLFSAAGATTFIQKATWWLVGLLAVTSITLAYFSTKSSKSILDQVPIEAVTTSAPLNSTTQTDSAGEAGTQQAAPPATETKNQDNPKSPGP